MRHSLKAALGCLVLPFVLAACATSEEAHMLRQPPIPPVSVVQAAPHSVFWRNVVVQEVRGAPEFRWFDGGAILTTRPTRVQTVQMLDAKLGATKLLAPNRIDAQYHLYVDFHDLRGPDVWLGSDKLASARMTFRLVHWRTGEVVKEQLVEASYRSNWAGITPEQARSFIAGPIGRAKDNPIQPLGGLIGGAIVGYYLNDVLIANSDVRGLSDFEAALAGGLLGGVGGLVASPADETRRVSATAEYAAFDGTQRRFAATGGLINLAFDRFMTDLGRDGSIVEKRAVSCASLNPNGGRFAVLRETADAYAVDCQGARYHESSASRAPRPRF